jgi:hypothetical protein
MIITWLATTFQRAGEDSSAFASQAFCGAPSSVPLRISPSGQGMSSLSPQGWSLR